MKYHLCINEEKQMFRITAEIICVFVCASVTESDFHQVKR